MAFLSNSAAGEFTTFLFYHRTPSAFESRCKEYLVAVTESVDIRLTVHYLIELSGKVF